MKTLVLFILGLILFVPLSALAVEKAADNTPPIAQSLIREGDYAVRLADTLGIVKTDSEGDAERALATAGISPKNGWISDFPVTPDILAEIRSAVLDAANGAKLSIDRKTADERLAALGKEFELPITAGAGSSERPKGYVTGEEYGTPADYQQDQEAIVDYYYDEGPPVITYYAPPPDYAYLYAWDPYPFWWGGYWFPGYYVLNDFTIIDYGHHGGHHHHHHHDGEHHDGEHHSGDRVSDRSGHDNKIISNRVVDKNTNKVATVDPVTRNTRTSSGMSHTGRPVNNTRFTNTDTRRGAENILRNTALRERGNSMTTTGRVGRSHSGYNSGFRSRSFDTAPSYRGRSFDTGRSATGWSRSFAPASHSTSPSFGNRGYSSPRSFSPGPSGGSRSFGTGGFGGGGHSGGGHGGGGGCRGGRC